MKYFAKKLMAIFVVALLLINSSLMVIVSTALDEVRSIIDKTKINAIVETNLEKYVNYDLGENSSRINGASKCKSRNRI